MCCWLYKPCSHHPSEYLIRTDWIRNKSFVKRVREYCKQKRYFIYFASCIYARWVNLKCILWSDVTTVTMYSRKKYTCGSFIRSHTPSSIIFPVINYFGGVLWCAIVQGRFIYIHTHIHFIISTMFINIYVKTYLNVFAAFSRCGMLLQIFNYIETSEPHTDLKNIFEP